MVMTKWIMTKTVMTTKDNDKKCNINQVMTKTIMRSRLITKKKMTNNDNDKKDIDEQGNDK